ncbi:MAG TPA: septal ring lytic transglycosylase RlpA family protein [Rhodocyclaceae bacterium]|nr:septal ring lytic transglycosylase RlpA family protein [Rhodocyclaceae bacterium]
MHSVAGVNNDGIDARSVTRLAAALGLGLLLAACGSQPPRPIAEREGSSVAPTAVQSTPPAQKPPYVLKRGGGFYRDDGPGDNPPSPEFLEAIPNAEPKLEPLHRFANKPYSVLGRDYVPLTSLAPYHVQGVASWYGRKFHGQKTSSGEVYDMYGMSAAHTTLPIPSYARITNPANGKSVVVRVNDRGPFHSDRVIDLSYAAAWKLGYIGNGSTLVDIESVLPGGPLMERPVGPPPETGDPLASLLERVEQAKEPSQVASSSAESMNSRGIFLQLGAFGNSDNAENLKSRLSRELASQPGTAEYSEKLTVVARAGIYRVQLGPWADHDQAERAAERLREVFEVKPVLIQQ